FLRRVDNRSVVAGALKKQQAVDEPVIAGTEAGFLVDPLANIRRRAAARVAYQRGLSRAHADRRAAQRGLGHQSRFSQRTIGLLLRASHAWLRRTQGE